MGLAHRVNKVCKPKVYGLAPDTQGYKITFDSSGKMPNIVMTMLIPIFFGGSFASENFGVRQKDVCKILVHSSIFKFTGYKFAIMPETLFKWIQLKMDVTTSSDLSQIGM